MLFDTFTGAAGELPSHVSDSGHNWSLVSGAGGMQRSGNGTLQGPSFSTAYAYSTWSPPSPNYYVEVVWRTFVVDAGQGSGPMVRAVGASVAALNCYYCIWFDGIFYLRKLVDGSIVELEQVSSAIATADVLRLEVSGSAVTTLTFKLNGVTLMEYDDESSPHTATGNAGLLMASAGASSANAGYHVDAIAADGLSAAVGDSSSLSSSTVYLQSESLSISELVSQSLESQQFPYPLLTAAQQQVLRELYLESHPWALQTIANANALVLENSGIWQLLAYFMTLDASYLTTAVSKYFAGFAALPADRNTTREYTWQLALMHLWLRPWMTPEQISDSEERLRQWGEDLLGLGQPGHGTFSTDSDEVSCHLVGALLIDMALGTTEFQDVVVTGGGSLNTTQMLAEFRTYFDKAVGGEWIESSEYNLGTVQIFTLGWLALGISRVQELVNWLLSHAQQLAWEITQDYREVTKWGDTEHAHDPQHERARINMMAIAISAGADPDGTLLNFMGNMTVAISPTISAAYNLWRALLVFDPRLIPASPTPDNFSGLRYSSGVGLSTYKRDIHHVEFFGSHSVGVHHEWNASNLRWCVTVDGVSEFILDHPQGYTTSAPFMNTPLMAGLAMMHDRTTISSQEITGGWQAVWHTEGERYPQPFYQPPPEFGEITRTVTFLDEGVLIASDVFAGDWPTNVNRYLYFGDQASIENAPHLWLQIWHIPHCSSPPEETDYGFRWVSLRGIVVRLITNAAFRRVDSMAGGTLEGGVYSKSVAGVSFNGFLHEGERQGYVIQLGADDVPNATITTRFELGEGGSESLVSESFQPGELLSSSSLVEDAFSSSLSYTNTPMASESLSISDSLSHSEAVIPEQEPRPLPSPIHRRHRHHQVSGSASDYLSPRVVAHQEYDL